MKKIFLKKSLLFVLGISLLVSKVLAADSEMADLGKIDYIYLLRSSLVMISIALVSFFSLAVIIERWFYFRKIKFNSRKVIANIEKDLKNKNYEAVLKACEKKNPLNNAIKTILENKDRSAADIEEIYEIVRTEEKANMEKFMVVLGTSAAIAPLLGLLGTVTGIIKAFSDLAAAGTGGPSVIAAGVSEALVTTAFGLIVAIPVLLFFNAFTNKIRVILTELDVNVRLIFFIMEK